MATFIIKETFKLTSRNLTVFLGDIVNGTVSIGQLIKLNATDSHRGMDLKISGINYADSLLRGTTQIGLMVTTVYQEDSKELDDLRIKNEEVEIVDAV